jgi:adenylate cyclase
MPPSALMPARGADFGVTTVAGPRLLVMPFHVPVTNETNQALTAGLFEQLSVELARYTDISLVAHNLDGGSAPDPVSAGIKVQAQFVISGSVRQAGQQIRVTARLHDVSANAIIWTECYDLDADTCLDLQAEDRIASQISGAVADYHGIISYTLSLRSVYSPSVVWNLRDAIQRHRYLARTLSERVYRVARADLEFGRIHAAHHPMIWAALAHTVFYGNVLAFDDDENWLDLVYRYAHRAFELDHKCAFGHVVMGLHALYRREYDEVFETCRRILQDNPHAPSTKLSAGFFRALAGDWESGTKMLNSALAGLPHPPSWAHRVTFLDHYRRKNYAQALNEISKYHAPENFTPALLRAAVLAQLGRIDEAASSVAEVLRVCPEFKNSASRYFRYLTAFDDIRDHLVAGLGKAGLAL